MSILTILEAMLALIALAVVMTACAYMVGYGFARGKRDGEEGKRG